MVIEITEFFDESVLDKEELKCLEILRQRQNKALQDLVPSNIQDLNKKPNLFKNKNAKG